MEKELLPLKNRQTTTQDGIEQLYQLISIHVDTARQNVQRSVNTEIINTYWFIGRSIVEEEQRGENRAEYGKSILKKLSAKLQTKYQRGFGVNTLENARKFYIIFSQDNDSLKSDTLSRKSYLGSLYIKVHEVPQEFSEVLALERT